MNASQARTAPTLDGDGDGNADGRRAIAGAPLGAMRDATASPLDCGETPSSDRAEQTSRAPKNAVFPGRYTAENGAEVVVFLIGLRFNGLRGLLPALQTFFKMPGMLEALGRKPELGCLGGHVAFGGRTTYVIQYWRSYEDLERFAHLSEEEHLPAWRWYARLGTKGSGTGIWHETFRVASGAYESVYVNMPRFGLAKATAHRSLAKGSSARERISAASATS